jgi:hypothetical protein
MSVQRPLRSVFIAFIKACSYLSQGAPYWRLFPAIAVGAEKIGFFRNNRAKTLVLQRFMIYTLRRGLRRRYFCG